jgi:DNA (cytosine-5)-methyltransferase 1
MKVGSTFSGVGGFDLGLERAGMEIVWQAEIDQWCRRVLESHWPDIKIYNDVKEINDSAEPVELLVGGFPCQDVSLAGRRAGIEEGERSSLFYEFSRIAEELQPNWFLLENVYGLLSSSNGRDFGTVLSEMGKIGYGIGWRVLDARFFGVPQRRRRVFIVGSLGEGGRERAVRALGAGGEGNLETSRCSWQKDSTGTEECFGEAGGKVIANALDRQAGGADDNSAQANHLVTQKFINTLQGGSNDRGYRIDAEAAAGGQLLQMSESTVRRLTPRECERLMSWPDDWTKIDGDKTPDNRRYGACGNGVVSNVSEWIAKRIMAIENEQ